MCKEEFPHPTKVEELQELKRGNGQGFKRKSKSGSYIQLKKKEQKESKKERTELSQWCLSLNLCETNNRKQKEMGCFVAIGKSEEPK